MRISVALCTYEGERYLPEQLESLLGQDRPPGELVACDDGSTDDTVAVLEDFAARAPFPVRIHRNTSNLGPTKNFEQAIGMCTGEAIALCDQDDVWLPPKLARAAEVLEAEPGVGMTFSDAELIDEEGLRTGERLWGAVRFTRDWQQRVDREGLLPVILRKDVVTGSTMIFRTRLRDAVCPIPEEWHHDAWASLICAFAADHRRFSEPLSLYRVHRAQEVGVFTSPEDEGRPGPRGPQGLGSLELRAGRSRRRRGVGPLEVRWRGEEGRRLLRELADGNARVAHWFNLAAERAAKTRPLENPVAERILNRVEARERHYRFRASLPSRRLERAPLILREWRGGAYRTLSDGALSALSDLVS